MKIKLRKTKNGLWEKWYGCPIAYYYTFEEARMSLFAMSFERQQVGPV